MTGDLSAEHRAAMLEVARAAIGAAAAGHGYTAPDRHDVPFSSGGAFVTLTVDGELRGCTGTLDPDVPMPHLIARLARSSALSDPRFPPLRADELPHTAIEISVLTPPIPVVAEDVEVGVHGLIAQRGHARGVLLPQIATEQGYTVEEFLAATCWKAGLPRDAWRDPGTRLLAFTAVVFAERQ